MPTPCISSMRPCCHVQQRDGPMTARRASAPALSGARARHPLPLLAASPRATRPGPPSCGCNMPAQAVTVSHFPVAFFFSMLTQPGIAHDMGGHHTCMQQRDGHATGINALRHNARRRRARTCGSAMATQQVRTQQRDGPLTPRATQQWDDDSTRSSTPRYDTWCHAMDGGMTATQHPAVPYGSLVAAVQRPAR